LSSKIRYLFIPSLTINCNRAWSLCIGRTSQISLGDIEIEKPMIISEVEEEQWIPYTDKGLASERNATQPSNIRAVYTSFSELSELIHDGLALVHAKGNFPQSANVLAVYKKYLEWYEGLPDQLRLGLNSTPTVLFTQSVHFFLVQGVTDLSMKHVLPLCDTPPLPTILEPQYLRIQYLSSYCLQRSGAEHFRLDQILQRPLHSPPNALLCTIYITDCDPSLRC
jgi:hypothetical protein